HGGEVLIEPPFVALPEILLKVLRLVGHDIEDALAGVQFANSGVDFLLRALEEELVEHTGSALLWGDRNTCARPRKRPPADVDAARERRKPRENADAFGNELVQRDRVAE